MGLFYLNKSNTQYKNKICFLSNTFKNSEQKEEPGLFKYSLLTIYK